MASGNKAETEDRWDLFWRTGSGLKGILETIVIDTLPTTVFFPTVACLNMPSVTSQSSRKVYKIQQMSHKGNVKFGMKVTAVVGRCC